eukprot:tig00000189_g14339.t1
MYGNLHYLERPQPYNLSLAYCFWALGLVGLFGAHRIYVGHYCLGILYFCTAGLFGVGWLIDLCLLPEIVREANETYLLEAPLLPTTYAPIPVAVDPHHHHYHTDPHLHVHHHAQHEHPHAHPYIPVAVPVISACPGAQPPCPGPQAGLYPTAYQGQVAPQAQYPPPYPVGQPSAPQQPPPQNPYYRPGP